MVRLIKSTPEKLNLFELLHPFCREKFVLLARTLTEAHASGATQTDFRSFETYRTPMRQSWMNQTLPNVSHAKPWQTPHNYGLAVDFVPCPNGIWNWNRDNDWSFLGTEAAKLGLDAPLPWDPGHVQLLNWREYVPSF